MKALTLALLAASALCACTREAAPENQAAANATVNAVETAVAGNETQPPAATAPAGGGNPEEGNGKAAAPPPRDVPGTGGPARPPRPRPSNGGETDQCGASRYQWLVGRPRSDIPRRPPRANWRVTCTSCPVTMDYSPQRLNIFYDAETERVEQVRCG